MRLTKRQSLLASMLLKQQDIQTVHSFAQLLNISERTVHSDLKIVATYLSERGYILEKKPGVGIKVVHQQKQLVQAKKIAESTMYSTEGRREKIIQLLLFTDQTITYDRLSDLFLISKTSLKNDFLFIEKLLMTGNQTVLLRDNQGTRISGDEKEKQKVYVRFNQYLLKEKYSAFELSEEQQWVSLYQYYGEAIVRGCFNVVYRYLKETKLSIAEHYITTFLNHLIVLVYRTAQGYHIDKALTAQCSAYRCASDLLERLSIRLDVSFTKEDVWYLSELFVSNRFEPVKNTTAYRTLVQSIIRKIGTSLMIDFTQDQKLEEQLLLHVPSMIYRLKEGNQTNNPFIDQIKNEFTVVFQLVWVALSEYEDELMITFTEDEIGFLAIYVQSAIERTKDSKKVLIVCPTGIVTSELLLNRVKNVLPAFTSIEVASLKEIEKRSLDAIDLIISTVRLNVAQTVVVVSPLLTDQDVKNISTTYNEKFMYSRDMNLSQYAEFRFLKPYVFRSLTFWEENFSSKETLLTEIGKRLYQQEIVTEKFIESMKQRERLGGTDVPSGAAIPHGNPRYVKQTVVAIIKNKKQLKWNEYLVDTIFVVCVAEADKGKIKGILSDIYRIVQQKETLEKLPELMKAVDE